MTLISHVITAYLLSVLLDLNSTLAIIGSILPDLIEIPFKIKHRKESHELLFTSASTFLIFFLLPKLLPSSLLLNYIKAFTIGYYSHIILDSLTVSGVYFLPLKKRISLMPHFKIRTGTFSEGLFIVILWIFLIVAIFLKPFISYYFEYYSLYKKGIIDKKEFLKGIFNH